MLTEYAKALNKVWTFEFPVGCTLDAETVNKRDLFACHSLGSSKASGCQESRADFTCQPL
ncbi:hypothetical protein SERLA73DRAFT_137511, partial [Serpula lacrymans var. lacrymans S7.3]